MGTLKRNKLEDYLSKTESIINSISESKNNISDLYITVQSEIDEVSPEEEDDFSEMIKDSLRSFLKELKSISHLFDRSPFQYERKTIPLELKKLKDFSKQLKLLDAYTEEICGFSSEFKEDIYKLIHPDADSETIEKIKEKKEFLDELMKQLIHFTVELEALIDILVVNNRFNIFKKIVRKIF